jgi:hypothetical protein
VLFWEWKNIANGDSLFLFNILSADFARRTDNKTLGKMTFTD